MKKIFKSKLDNKERIEEKGIANYASNFNGKVFQINKHSVVVEEVLAEGESSLHDPRRDELINMKKKKLWKREKNCVMLLHLCVDTVQVLAS